jgi:gliding motility-associated-like protein
MSNFKKNIENLYSETFDGFKIEPSNKVWENLEKNLNRGGFTKFNLSKFNVYYLSIIILVISATLLFVTNKSSKVSFNANDLLSISNISINRNIINLEIDENKNNIQTSTNNNLKFEKQNLSEISLTDKPENDLIKSKEEATDISNVLFLNILKDEITNNQYVNNYKCEKFESSDCIGCAPLIVSFTNKIENAVNLKWTFGNGETSTDENPECIYNESGQYTVCLEYTQNNVTGFFYDTVIVYQKPDADFETNAQDKLLPKTDIDFLNKSQNAIQYLWYFGDSEISNEFEPKHSYSLFGEYTIKLLAISADNCIDSIISNLVVENENYKIIFPDAFTPDKSGSNGGYYNLNSLDNNVFYPAYYDAIDEYELLIYNRKGQLIFKSTDINIGWDGYYKNEVVKSDVYVYLAKVKFTKGEDTVKTGSVTVINKK